MLGGNSKPVIERSERQEECRARPDAAMELVPFALVTRACVALAHRGRYAELEPGKRLGYSEILSRSRFRIRITPPASFGF